MRRACAAAVVLLLTASPVVAAACAIACPMAGLAAPASAATTDMPADCATTHHAAGDTGASDSAVNVAAAPLAGMAPDCCAIPAGPVDLATASGDRADTALASAPVDPNVVSLVMPALLPVRAPASPPRPPHARARRTDILRL